MTLVVNSKVNPSKITSSKLNISIPSEKLPVGIGLGNKVNMTSLAGPNFT